MSSTEAPALSDFLADAIRDQADDIVERWIDAVLERISLRPAQMLPREAIRDHLPMVVRAIAETLRGPADAVPMSADDALRSHATMRYDQGYDIEEMLEEYRVLDGIVENRILDEIERFPGGTEPVEVGRICLRLARGLTRIPQVTVSVYRDIEVRHKRDLHEQLEEYVRTITHELKQPLHAITAGTGMLEEDEISSKPRAREHSLDIIRRGIERAVGLIDDIRNLALVEEAEQQGEWKPLESSVQLVLDQLKGQADARGVRLEIEGDLPNVHVDGARVDIALMNLVSNAIKYSDPQKPQRWARIEARRAEPEEALRWEISVSDNGLGIPTEVQPQIFQRRFRAHPEVEEGTGLGLAITRQVVEQTGGRISFESERGQGSIFRIVVRGQPREDLGR